MSSLGTSRLVGISGTALRPKEGKKTVPEIEIGCFSGDHDFFLLDKKKFSDKKSVSNEKGKKTKLFENEAQSWEPTTNLILKDGPFSASIALLSSFLLHYR